MKKKPMFLFFCIAIVFALCACSSDTANDRTGTEGSSLPEESALQPSQNESPEVQDEQGAFEGIKSGSYTLPCGMSMQFFDSVRNDTTGNWRRAATADSYIPADYALEYYNEMFSSDNEIHSIWNATLETNTRISVASGMLFVDTFEYVKGEEHDAKIMFSGQLLDSKIIDIETGEEIEE